MGIPSNDRSHHETTKNGNRGDERRLLRRGFLKRGLLGSGIVLSGPLGGLALPAQAQETAPPGEDQVGGPDDLRESVTVRATVVESSDGDGQVVFTPAIVWLQPGGTVSWQFEVVAHSVTAYHPDNGRPLRIPVSADAFDSGVSPAGETFEHTFDTPGVYNYFCRPHEFFGMVGVVIVDTPLGGPGTTDPEAVPDPGDDPGPGDDPDPEAELPPAARARLDILLERAGVRQDDGSDVDPELAARLARFAAVEAWNLDFSFLFWSNIGRTPQRVPTAEGTQEIVAVDLRRYDASATLTSAGCPPEWNIRAASLGLGDAVACWLGDGTIESSILSWREVYPTPDAEFPESTAITAGSDTTSFEATPNTDPFEGFELLLSDTGEYFLSAPEVTVLTATVFSPALSPVPGENELTVTPGLFENLLSVTRSVRTRQQTEPPTDSEPVAPGGYLILSENPVSGVIFIEAPPDSDGPTPDGFRRQPLSKFSFSTSENVLPNEGLEIVEGLDIELPLDRFIWNWTLTPAGGT